MFLAVARILMIFQPADGGAFRHVAELASGLSERGHEVLACGPRRPDDVAPERFAALALRRGVAPGADGRAVVEVARAISRLRPDVVHLHSSKAGAVGRLARWASPATPVVYSPHGYAFAGHFERAAERRAYRAVEAALAPLATRVLCVCEAERRLAASIGPAARTRTVHNGVASALPAAVHEAVAEAHSRGPVVSIVAPLRPGKGIETMLAAMPAVLAGHPTTTLLIAGDGSEAGALRARARSDGLDAAVRFLGDVPEPAAVIAGADVVVHPSWAEAFPYAVLEAMAAGAAVVATDVGGTGEAIEDGRSGVLVPPRDPGALARAIDGVLSDRELARDLGGEARRRVRSRFSVPGMVRGTLGVYAEVSDGVRRDVS